MAKGPLQGELSSAAWARGAQSSPQARRDGDEKTERRVEMETQGEGRRRAPVGSGCLRRAVRPAWGTAGRGEGLGLRGPYSGSFCSLPRWSPASSSRPSW